MKLNFKSTIVLTFLAACGGGGEKEAAKGEDDDGGLKTVPTELHGKWYSKDACKDCDVTDCYGTISAASVEYIKEFDPDWRTSTFNKKKKGLDLESLILLKTFTRYDVY